jgi:hypothetical protein
MRPPTAYRELNQAEKNIARDVFRNTIPYGNVYVTDGLGGYDRPFTIPAPRGRGPWDWDDTDYWIDVAVGFAQGPVGDVVDKLKNFFGSKPAGKYLLNVGNAYAGMAGSEQGRELLIHELTHVWQGEHSLWEWSFVIRSGWCQVSKGDAAYDYDATALHDSKWGDFNVEQQAQIVEHWYTNGRLVGDPRFRLYYTGVLGGDWTEYVRRFDPTLGVEITPVPGAPLNVPEGYFAVKPDPYVLPILQPRYGIKDEAGARGQIQKLEETFRKLRDVPQFYDIPDLIRRLEVRRGGDKLSEYFSDNLQPAARGRLLDILRRKVP